ncbi:MAG: DUF2934 domain-containing protein [Terriglobales bacterium]|jgi:hypothetical protein
MKRIEAMRPNQASQLTPTLEEEIRNRAYVLYQQRGNEGGFELEDWLQAEAEVLDAHRARKAA